MGDPRYSDEPADDTAYLQRFDRIYTRIAALYDVAVRWLPVWKSWLEEALPHICGTTVLEVSFGTGYLLTRYAGRYDVHGVDLNSRMVTIAQNNLRRMRLHASLTQGSVMDLPYAGESFDTVVNTMAFSGYPRAGRALSEMRRVLKRAGRLVMIDINYPKDRNRIGMMLTRCWASTGDIVRDMDSLLIEYGFAFEDIAVGGFGSVHLYVCDLNPD